MRVRYSLLVVLVAILAACVEDEFPRGLYDYQVERLLSGESEKIWSVVSETEDGVTTVPTSCSDSLRLYIVPVGTDSINISWLFPSITCGSFDTLRLGNSNATSEDDSQLFTDSLQFADGNYWLIQSVTSQTSSITTSADATIRLISR